MEKITAEDIARESEAYVKTHPFAADNDDLFAFHTLALEIMALKERVKALERATSEFTSTFK